MSFLQKNKITSLFIQGLSVLIAVLIAFSAFNSNLIKADAEAETEEIPVWDGTKASGLSAFEGSGTSIDPYQIENASQLAYIVSTDITDGYYFELTKDIRINDTTSPNWKESARNWVWADIRFVGYFNGNGHTIDGLFHKGSQKRFGLFSYVGDSVFENIILTNASVTTSTSEEGSGIFSSQASAPTKYRGIIIDETCEISAPNSKGVSAIVARSNQNVDISNCAVFAKIEGGSHVGAFYGTHWGGTQTLNSCFTTSNVPVMSSRALSGSANNYAVVSDAYGTTVLTADQMKGESAKENMSGLDFEKIWKLSEEGYPVICENPKFPWGGEKAENFAGGNGTESSPYLIENAAQLYKMVAEYSNAPVSSKNLDRKYFRITDDIYLNNVQWYTSGITNYPNSDNYTTGFSGVIYGDGHTIYDLYSNKSSATVGLLPVATQGTEIYDLHLENGNLPKAAWNTYAVGGFIGLAKGGSDSTPIVIKGCSVKNFNIESRDASSAFVGYVRSQSVEIYNSYAVKNQIGHTATSAANTGAFIAMATGNDYLNSIIISNSFCSKTPIEIYTGDKMNEIITFENVYTSNEDFDGSIEGITKITDAQMKGDDADQYMSKLDFDTVWKTNENDYPENFIYVRPDYVWDGTKAENFAGGTGKKNDPYLIENGEQLYKMVVEFTNASTAKDAENEVTYFKLKNDIYLNDVKARDLENTTEAAWGAKFTPWFSVSSKTLGFCGDLDGDGYTVYGLYCNNTRYSGLIPMLTEQGNIHNLNLKDSYVKGYESAGGIAGYVKAHYTLSPVSISYCSVENIVIEGAAKQVGAVVGGCEDVGLTISDCSVTNSKVSSSNSDNPNLASGIIGYGWGGVKKVINCFTDDSVHPVTAATSKDDFDIIDNFVEYTNVYTSFDKNFDAAEGVKYLTKEDMQGDKAKRNMKGFDFNSVWKTVEDSYPVIALDLSKVWDGSKADEFAGGSGTENDPYLIENGAQLYKMVADYSNTNSSARPESHTYFKITKDINLGNKQWYTTGLTNYPDNEVYADIGFSGIIYGEGHTIYGLYSNKKSATVGLIPVATQGAEIHDLHLENGNLPKADWDTYAVGGFIGMVKGTSNSAPIVIKGCSITNFKIESRDASSAFIGYVRSQSVEIYNCYATDNKISHTSTENGMNTGAFVAVTGGNDWLNHIIISNSYCDDISPIPYLNEKFQAITTYNNVYTLDSAYDNSVTGIKKLTSSQMTGDNAKEYMKGFDFDRAWKIVVDGYPVHVLYVRPSHVWDGKIAEEFAGGEGTYTKPYLIENGAQLYKMVKEYSNSKTASGSINKTTYFKLISDIHLNDVREKDLENPSEASWGAIFNTWYSVTNKDYGFSGDLDGDGYTVYGLYCANTRFSGLVSLLTDGGSVHNLNLKNSYIKGYECAGGIVGTVSGHYLLASTSVSYCTVDNTVIDGSGKQIGGIIGGCDNIGLNVTDCSVTNSSVSSTNSDNPNLASGIIGYGWGGVKYVTNCFTDSSVHPVTATTNKESFDILDNYVTYKNVYTSAKKNFDAAEGVTYLSSDNDLKGISVSVVLKGFNFEDDWLANSDYPTLKKGAGNWIYDTKSAGQVWSGKVSRFYASGDGSKESPFEIETGGQLALLANDALNGKTANKYYKITEDIILNDTSSTNWQYKANEWYTGSWGKAFKGYLDGGYHTISGLYLNKTQNNYSGSDYYGGLFACISKGAVIEKLGIVNSSLVFTGGSSTKYLGAFAGFVDQYKIDGTDPKEYPIIRECFADTTVYLEGSSCGGFIGCATRPIRVEDSFFTGKVKTTGRGLFGYSKMGSTIDEVLVKNFYTADSEYAVLCNVSYDNIKVENCYTSSAQDKEGLTRLFIDRMCGKEAKKNMTGFDFKKIWSVRGDNETPGLKGFDKDSYTNVMNPSDIVVSFESNCDILVESITGKAYSKLTLPKIERDGYIFEGWYAFPELDVPFDFDYFPTFNTILYAKWTLDGFEQDFERYEDSIYDYHMGYEYYRPTSYGYSAKYVRSGAKSMHRLSGTAEELDFLLFYKEELEVGKAYKMVYYATTDMEKASLDVSLVNLDWPDVYCDNNGVQKIATIDNLTDGEWQEFTHTFIAKSKWIAIRTSDDSSVYFDDFVLYATDDVPVDNNESEKDDESVDTTPETNDDNVESTPEISTPVSPEADDDTVESTPVSPEDNLGTNESTPETSTPVSPETNDQSVDSTPEIFLPVVSPENNNNSVESLPDDTVSSENNDSSVESVPENSDSSENNSSVVTKPNSSNKTNSNNNITLWIVITVSVILVVIVGVLLTIYMVKKRSKR